MWEKGLKKEGKIKKGKSYTKFRIRPKGFELEKMGEPSPKFDMG